MTAELRDPIIGILRSGAPAGLVAMTIPVSVSGIPKGNRAIFDQELFDLIGPDNQRYQRAPSYIGQDFVVLLIRYEVYERLKNAQVELKGPVPVILYRTGSRTSIPVGVKGWAPGAGRCSSEVIELPGYPADPERKRFLRVACESPDGSALPAYVSVRQSADNGSSGQLDWTGAEGLSPLKRAVVTFPLSPWEEPGPSWKLEITPDIALGWQVVNLDLRNLRMRDYVFRSGE